MTEKQVKIRTKEEMLALGGILDFSDIELPDGCNFVDAMEIQMPENRIITVRVDEQQIIPDRKRHNWIEENWSISPNMIKYWIPEVLLSKEGKDD